MAFPRQFYLLSSLNQSADSFWNLTVINPTQAFQFPKNKQRFGVCSTLGTIWSFEIDKTVNDFVISGFFDDKKWEPETIQFLKTLPCQRRMNLIMNFQNNFSLSRKITISDILTGFDLSELFSIISAEEKMFDCFENETQLSINNRFFYEFELCFSSITG